jgi:ESF2/ABP1 family protein
MSQEEDNLIDEQYIFEDEEEVGEDKLQEFNDKVRRSGVVYLSYIPEGMTVGLLRRKFENYGVSRIYLVPDKPTTNSKKKQNYKEGWVEFTNKLMAKLCEYELNGKMIGGKKRKNDLREELWTIKYLHKFKWHHLMEKLSSKQKLREVKMKAEMSQARRENDFIMKKFEASKNRARLLKKRERDLAKEEGSEEVNEEQKKIEDQDKYNKLLEPKRKFKQRKPIIKGEHNKANNENI